MGTDTYIEAMNLWNLSPIKVSLQYFLKYRCPPLEILHKLLRNYSLISGPIIVYIYVHAHVRVHFVSMSLSMSVSMSMSMSDFRTFQQSFMNLQNYSPRIIVGANASMERESAIWVDQVQTVPLSRESCKLWSITYRVGRSNCGLKCFFSMYCTV